MGLPSTSGTELLIINEPGTGFVDQSRRLCLGDGADSLGGSGRTDYGSVLKQRGTANVALVVRAGDTYQPVVGSQVFLYDVTNSAQFIIFAGTIDKIQTSWWGESGDRLVALACVSFEQAFDTIRVPGKLYTNQSAGSIFTDVLALATGWPGTAGTISDGVTIDTFLIEGEPTIADVFDKLAVQSSFIWNVDISNLTVNFSLPAITAAPFTLAQSDPLFEAADYLEDRHDFRDRQIITLDWAAFGESGELFIGAGQTAFNLRNPVHQVTDAWITKNTQNTATGTLSGQPTPGDTVTVGYPTTGSIYNWTPNSPYAVGQEIIDPLNHRQVCTTGGTSSNPGPPTWNDAGGTTVDNTVRWLDKGPVGFGPYQVAVYEFVAVLDNTQYGQVKIGGSAAATLQNLVDAINSETATRGIGYSLPTWENQLVNADQPSGSSFTVRNKFAGQGFKAALSEVCANFSWSAAETGGGTTTFGTYSLTVGISSAQAQSLSYTPGSNLVTLPSPLNAGTNLAVAYQRIDGNQIAVEDTPLVAARAAIENGTGKYQALTSDNSATTAQGLAEAQAALAAFKVIPKWFEFITFRPGLRVNQALPVTFHLPYGPDTTGGGVDSESAVASLGGTGKCLYIALSSPPSGWETPGFSDGSWPTPVVQGGATFGSPIAGTDWITDVSGGDHLHFSSILFRKNFTLSVLPSSASLQISADDFVTAVFVNGNAILVPGSTHLWPPITVNVPVAFLVAGTNLIAVQVTNGGPEDGTPELTSLDFLITTLTSAQWIIQEIEGELIPSSGPIGTYGHWRYTVRCVDSAQIGSYLDFWEGLGGGGGGDITGASGTATAPASSAAGVQVALSGTVIGSEPEINFIPGTGVTLGIIDDPSNQKVDVTISASSVGGVSLHTTSYTLLATDSGKLQVMNSGSAQTFTLPATPPASPWVAEFENIGAGTLTIDRNGNTIDAAATNLTLAQNQGVIIFSNGTAYYTERGMGGGGTLTSLTLVEPAEFIVAGSPTSGPTPTITVTKATQTAATAWMGPVTGSAAVPTFRAIVSSDLPPAAAVLTLKKYVQTWTAQTSVTLNHNLGTTAVIVQVYDSAGILTEPETTTIVDANNVTVTFGSAFDGTAVVLGASAFSANTVYSTSWTAQTAVPVTHNLGTTKVLVQVFDAGGLLTDPEKVTITSSNVVTLAFGSSFTGSVVVMAAPNAVVAVSSYSTSWTTQTSVTVTHGLNTSTVAVQVFDAGGLEIEAESVTITSSSVVTLTFGSSFTGSVTVLG